MTNKWYYKLECDACGKTDWAIVVEQTNLIEAVHIFPPGWMLVYVAGIIVPKSGMSLKLEDAAKMIIDKSYQQLVGKHHICPECWNKAANAWGGALVLNEESIGWPSWVYIKELDPTEKGAS